MNIVMFTNTYTPHVGGVAVSVSNLALGLRRRGHRVLVIAPDFPDAPDREVDVIRVPAVQRFAGSDFSVPIPISRPLSEELDAFRPDIVHSHHPFLLGDTALRVSAARDIPVIFTYHTRYELYGHYVAQDSELLKRLVVSLSVGYCNLCNCVIAPSESTALYLQNCGVTTPLKVVPTGVDAAKSTKGDGGRARGALRIPQSAFVIGHVGRLAPEKNLNYLTEAVKLFLLDNKQARLVVAGEGPARSEMARIFAAAGLAQRVHFTGILTGAALADLYAAMDVFAFSSQSETQGLVLAEAMTVGIPVVALDAPGVREIVRDGANGRLLRKQAAASDFAQALACVAKKGRRERARMGRVARATAGEFSADRCLERTLAVYDELRGANTASRGKAVSAWHIAGRRIARELEIIGNIANAVTDAVLVVKPAADE